VLQQFIYDVTIASTHHKTDPPQLGGHGDHGRCEISWRVPLLEVCTLFTRIVLGRNEWFHRIACNKPLKCGRTSYFIKQLIIVFTLDIMIVMFLVHAVTPSTALAMRKVLNKAIGASYSQPLYYETCSIFNACVV